MHLLHCVDEFLRLNWWRINHFFNERPLTVGISSRYMHKHLQLLESLAQFHHPSNSQQVHVHGKPARYTRTVSMWSKCFKEKSNLVKKT